MNDLLHYFETNKRRLIHKWIHYFEIYERHLSRYRGTDVCIVEIGVSQGGSLQMWRDYLGVNAKIIGIDIDPRCQELEEEGTEIIIGNQEDRDFLRSLKERIPHIDILLDDGGHTMTQQIATFEELFPHIDQNGIYLCEDLHTSYWHEYGGGFRHPSSFIEYSKNLIDLLNAWHSREPEHFLVNSFTQSAYSMSFYDSVLVIEKRAMSPPRVQMTGHPAFAQNNNVVHEQQEQPSDHSVANQGASATSNLVGFQTCAEDQTLQTYAHHIQRALEQTQQELAALKIQLQASKSELEQHKVLANFEIQEVRHHLEDSRSQLAQVENQLLKVQQKRSVQQLQIEQMRQKLSQLKENLKRTKSNLHNTRKQLKSSQAVVEAMQNSKFWRLRDKWFQFKHFF